MHLHLPIPPSPYELVTIYNDVVTELNNYFQQLEGSNTETIIMDIEFIEARVIRLLLILNGIIENIENNRESNICACALWAKGKAEQLLGMFHLIYELDPTDALEYFRNAYRSFHEAFELGSKIRDSQVIDSCVHGKRETLALLGYIQRNPRSDPSDPDSKYIIRVDAVIGDIGIGYVNFHYLRLISASTKVKMGLHSVNYVRLLPHQIGNFIDNMKPVIKVCIDEFYALNKIHEIATAYPNDKDTYKNEILRVCKNGEMEMILLARSLYPYLNMLPRDIGDVLRNFYSN
jgi:hypothetical protein